MAPPLGSLGCHDWGLGSPAFFHGGPTFPNARTHVVLRGAFRGIGTGTGSPLLHALLAREMDGMRPPWGFTCFRLLAPFSAVEFHTFSRSPLGGGRLGRGKIQPGPPLDSFGRA